jgi:DNA topoisomerase IB
MAIKDFKFYATELKSEEKARNAFAEKPKNPVCHFAIDAIKACQGICRRIYINRWVTATKKLMKKL